MICFCKGFRLYILCIYLIMNSNFYLQQKGLTEIFQKLQAAGISSSWQQLIKPQIEQIKKEKEQEKPENMQNNILNIPMVFRNSQLQSSNNFCNSDHLAINTDNLNMQLMNEQQENESNVQTVLKVEQQVQTDFPTEKKPRFRAKLDVKISVSSDGTVFYCCPECAFRLQDKTEMEQHIQTHLQVYILCIVCVILSSEYIIMDFERSLRYLKS